ncbi:MAG: hypothetical protein LBP35_02795 [Candidatus Ancillula trichonymphae]|jgi:hypothetical protein|nr:hypothetical protein [Candidatus Ancillula trichonymphae]
MKKFAFIRNVTVFSSIFSLLMGFLSPASVFGAEERITAQIAQQLENSVDNQRCPTGVFDFLTARIEARERGGKLQLNMA